MKAAKLGVLVATILASSMVFIDGSVVNVILPVLQKAFQANPHQIQWVVEAYLLFLASLMLLGGGLGDRFGRRKIFVLGTVFFMISSVGCAVSQSIFQLTLCRSLQGIAGALLTPGSLAIINHVFPKEERGRAIGTWSGFSALMMVLGPLLGGFLSDHASWRYVFLINIPIGLCVLFFTFKFIPETETGEGKVGLDYFGAVLSVIFIGCLVYGLIQTEYVVVGMGVLFLAIFIFAESKIKTPLVPLTFFKSRVFSTINILCFFLYASLSIVFYFLPFQLIDIQGFSATEAGAANLPFILIMFFSSRFTGGLYSKVGARLPIFVGASLSAAGFLMLGFLPALHSSYWTAFFPGLVLFGVGMSLCVSPLTTAVLAALPEKFSGIASGINNSVTRIAGLIGIAVMPKVSTLDPVVFMKSFREIFVVSAVLAFTAALCALTFLKGEQSPGSK